MLLSCLFRVRHLMELDREKSVHQGVRPGLSVEVSVSTSTLDLCQLSHLLSNFFQEETLEDGVQARTEC